MLCGTKSGGIRSRDRDGFGSFPSDDIRCTVGQGPPRDIRDLATDSREVVRNFWFTDDSRTERHRGGSYNIKRLIRALSQRTYATVSGPNFFASLRWRVERVASRADLLGQVR